MGVKRPEAVSVERRWVKEGVEVESMGVPVEINCVAVGQLDKVSKPEDVNAKDWPPEGVEMEEPEA